MNCPQLCHGRAVPAGIFACATMLALRAGKSIRWIAEQLGHWDPAITLRIYAQVLPDEGEDLGFLDFDDRVFNRRPPRL